MCGLIVLGQIESNYDEVTDSFDAMNLKSELLRGKAIEYLRIEIDRLTCVRCLRLWFRTAICYPAAGYHASNQRYSPHVLLLG